MSDFERELVQLLPFLRNYALRIAGSPEEAADLVQDCVERALRKAHLYRPGTNFNAWMFTLMRNLLINQKRRGKIARRHAERAQAEAVHSAAPTQVTTIFLAQTLSALDGLGAEEHEAVRLLGVEERTYEEAASDLGLPLGTLKSRLFRARAKLRARLDLEGADALAPDNPAAAA